MLETSQISHFTDFIGCFIELYNHKCDLDSTTLKSTHVVKITCMMDLPSCTVCESSVGARISFADVPTSAFCYQNSHVIQVLKRPHKPHLLCYQLLVAACMHTRSPVILNTQTSLSRFSRGAEPELCKLRAGRIFVESDV